VFDKEGVSAGVSKALDWFEARKTQTTGEGSVEGKENATNGNLQQDGNDRSPPLFDLMTSDIAPSTTGITGVDQYRSIELNIAVLEIADALLKKNGDLVLKVFIGEDIDELVRAIKTRFLKLSRFKPKACRDRSFEEYFICLGKK
jgi:23S rRNA U2552 (ribose-2'-O)-methylase RlmE/FtsJ